MKEFEYTAVDVGGRKVQGVLTAESALALDRRLEDRGLTVTRVLPVRHGSTGRGRARWSRADLVVFTNQTATLVGAGVPILQGLGELAKRMRTPGGKAVVTRLVEDLGGGASLAEAMDRQPTAFPDIYRASVRAGELSGETPAVLRRMALFLEWLRSIRATTLQALVYPAVLCLAIAGLVVLLLTFLLPRILKLFPGGRAQLPRETRIVMALSDFLTQHTLGLGLGGIAAVVLVCSLRRQRKLRLFASRLLLGIPRLGGVVRMLATARFASTAYTLHHSGCDVFQSLRISGAACGNTYLQHCFEEVAERVRAGSTITEGLSKAPLMDPMLVQVAAIGEQSGELDQALQQLVQYYDEEVPRAVKFFLSLFEPCLLIGAAGVVTFILMAALMPIFSLYESL